MHETEIKILGIDRKKILEKLESLGAKKIFDDIIHAVYYDTADMALKRQNSILRLRKEGKKAVLTFKSHVEDKKAKVREEKEVVVSDFEVMNSILGLLGFSGWLRMSKKRTTYDLEGTHFELDKYHDEYSFIPEFLEIEGKDFGTIIKYAELLGYSERDCRPWDALQVAEYYRDQGKSKKPLLE